MNDGDELEKARRHLNRASSELDELVVARLRAARKRAVDASRRRPFTAWIPLPTLAAGLLAVTVTLWWWQVPESTVNTASAEDLELLMSKESPDFFAEIDFYHWIGDQNDSDAS